MSGTDRLHATRLIGRIRIFLVALLLPSVAVAGDRDFLPTYNQSPLVQIFGLPSLGSARPLEQDRIEVSLSVEASSHFFIGSNTSEVLMLDGETHRLTLAARYGTGRAEWGIEVPYLAQSGGFMDSFIESWHDVFGMPNGGREAVPRNQLAYVYQRNGVDRLRLTRRNDGVGDVRLRAAWALLLDDAGADATLHASLKLPTGDAPSLLGSGAADVALWLNAGCAPAACPGALYWSVAGGLLGVGRGDLLPEMQRSVVPFAGTALGWRASPSLVLKAELLMNGPFYRDSALPPLDAASWQLILGGTWNLTSLTALDVGVSEDLTHYTAPDVSLLIALRSIF